MTTTSANAIDEISAIFNDMLSTLYPGTAVRWNGKEENEPPAVGAPWFRFTVKHADGDQASLSCQHGQRRWRRDGLIIVQCFAPLNGGSITLAQRMAESVRDAYQGQSTPGGVWFRRARTEEVGVDESWYNVNAIAQFTYDEVR